MEYIKKEELIKGEIYTHINENVVKYKYLNNNNKVCGIHIGENKTRFISDLSIHTGSFNITGLRLATPEEKHWLETCIKLDKFITFEEAMKTFIPEYVEWIDNIGSGNLGYQTKDHFKKNKIFKTDVELPSHGFQTQNWIKHLEIYANNYKPSTKEAYDAQFVVKEPEFVLPEKWCLKITKENLDFCKSLENNELHYKKNYNYYVNGYYSAIRSDSGNYGFSGIPKDFTEITFEQFKKYILKEEIVEEIIEPLPQFKVIETIETITKVENNEGNQFFINDKIKVSLNMVQKIISFSYNEDKTEIFANFNQNLSISINDIEHYIEPKVEETLLEKAKRLYPVGTKVKTATSNNFEIIIKDQSKFKLDLDNNISVTENYMIHLYCSYENKWANIIE